jgi:hypothetical protein
VPTHIPDIRVPSNKCTCACGRLYGDSYASEPAGGGGSLARQLLKVRVDATSDKSLRHVNVPGGAPVGIRPLEFCLAQLTGVRLRSSRSATSPDGPVVETGANASRLKQCSVTGQHPLSREGKAGILRTHIQRPQIRAEHSFLMMKVVKA